MKIEYPKNPKTFSAIDGTLWKYGNCIVESSGRTIAWSLWVALADDKPWWCPCWLMEKIKKHILAVHCRDLKITITEGE